MYLHQTTMSKQTKFVCKERMKLKHGPIVHLGY